MMHASKLFRNVHKIIQLPNIGKLTLYYQVTFFNFLDYKKTGRISIQAWLILCLIVPLKGEGNPSQFLMDNLLSTVVHCA
jgi:hypothetical protein